MRHLSFFLLLALAGSFSAQECELLTIDGVWLDPFDSQRINVLCNNASLEEIYSYPGWVMRDLDGNVIAEEEVVYFGIAGSSYHFLDLPNPWLDDPSPISVIMELWTGFGESMACSFEWEFVPRELEWAGTGDGGCFPVMISSNIFMEDGCSLDLDLIDGAGQSVWSGVLEMNESNDFSAQSDSLCLSQSECYEIHAMSSPTNYFSLELSDPAENFSWALSHWNYFTSFEEVSSLDTTFIIDLYGGDCDLVQGVSHPDTPLSSLHPNPVASGGTFRVARGANDLVTIWDASGRRIALMQGKELTSPREPGMYYVVIQSILGSQVHPLVVR